jgi:hypothetical protein
MTLWQVPTWVTLTLVELALTLTQVTLTLVELALIPSKSARLSSVCSHP